jgi:hypothetical protein
MATVTRSWMTMMIHSHWSRNSAGNQENLTATTICKQGGQGDGFHCGEFMAHPIDSDPEKRPSN